MAKGPRKRKKRYGGSDPIRGVDIPVPPRQKAKLPEPGQTVKKIWNGEVVAEYDAYYNSPQWRGKRAYVCKRDDNTCQYCGLIGHQADHILPRKQGGSDKVDNLVCCCHTCNKTAGNRVFPDFAAKKAYILANRERYVTKKPRQHFRQGDDFPSVTPKPLTGLKLRLAQKYHPDKYSEDS